MVGLLVLRVPDVVLPGVPLFHVEVHQRTHPLVGLGAARILAEGTIVAQGDVPCQGQVPLSRLLKLVCPSRRDEQCLVLLKVDCKPAGDGITPVDNKNIVCEIQFRLAWLKSQKTPRHLPIVCRRQCRLGFSLVSAVRVDSPDRALGIAQFLLDFLPVCVLG